MTRNEDATDDPAAIRARIARTRASLKRKLRAIKDQLLGTTSRAHRGGKNIMTQKKTNPKGSSARHHSTSKKESHPKKTSTSHKGGTSRMAKAVGKKAKEVLGKVLTRAAQGAMAGAAEGATQAFEPAKEKSGRGRKHKKA
jgi:hypothetical protein